MTDDTERMVAERFWARTDKRGPDECWPWLGSVVPKDRRGTMSVGGKNVTAPRISLMVHGIAIPPGAFACHHCDNPNCVNPAHLFLGDAGDNARDAVAKGRGPVMGARNRRLTPLAERFWKWVDKTGECWEWRGTRSPNGYGQFYSRGRLCPPHRWLWQELHGPIARNIDVRHRCGNRACVRPAHLLATTRSETLLARTALAKREGGEG